MQEAFEAALDLSAYRIAVNPWLKILGITRAGSLFHDLN